MNDARAGAHSGYGVYATGAGTGIYGQTSNTGNKNGVYGSAGNCCGSGVYGQNSGMGYGVAGRNSICWFEVRRPWPEKNVGKLDALACAG